MTDVPEIPKKTARTKAETLVQMSKEAQRVQRRIGADACIVICFFKDGKEITLQDAGQFPMPPADFYGHMVNAHKNGQLGHNAPKSRIIKPN